ncbi:MAG: NUDIX domain-containing protein [Clostridia bacterium]|nr:NUDIX domain-containing protein [Clostridia bacterium]
MDITLDVEGYKLNVRAAVIILHNNKILVHRNIKSDHYALVGGRVEIGENSAKTVKREIQEELGKQIELTGYYSTIENFFELNGSKYHEIMFVHKAEFVNDEDKKIEYTLHNIEGEEYLQYEWIKLDELENYNIVPRCIIEVLRNKQFPVHKINDELLNS